jgi:TonB-dependent SusC/RagA subfamily outer membrane receptor
LNKYPKSNKNYQLIVSTQQHNMKKKLLLILFLPGVTCGAYAANHNGSFKGKPGTYINTAKFALTATPIKVVVRDNIGQPIPGVSIKVKGTTNGGPTDVNGSFTINAQIGDVLVISYLGFITQEVKVATGADMNIVLAEDSKQLGEVVVTALGIRKERRSLGYSVSEVKGEDLTKAREPNFVNALAGKVAGVNITNMSGGPGASTNILIRGVSSISQTNQPLYVINGVPVESQPGGVANYLSGKGNNNGGSQYDNSSDNGDAISNINPDDIESISVLKGAAAAALYGSRAKAGVILITTKTAKSNSVEFNSNYIGETIIDPTHWQYQYGQGATNTAPKRCRKHFSQANRVMEHLLAQLQTLYNLTV